MYCRFYQTAECQVAMVALLFQLLLVALKTSTLAAAQNSSVVTSGLSLTDPSVTNPLQPTESNIVVAQAFDSGVLKVVTETLIQADTPTARVSVPYILPTTTPTFDDEGGNTDTPETGDAPQGTGTAAASDPVTPTEATSTTGAIAVSITSATAQSRDASDVPPTKQSPAPMGVRGRSLLASGYSVIRV
jgi:hypothetical protein